MKKKKIILLVLMFCGIMYSVYANDEWLTDFTQAQKISKETGKPILSDFSGSDWCGWCIRLNNEVFSKSSFQNYAKDNLILFLADFPMNKPQTDTIKKQNEELAEKYGIQGYPTVLLLDSNGKVLLKTGYLPGGPEKYIDNLKPTVEKYMKK